MVLVPLGKQEQEQVKESKVFKNGIADVYFAAFCKIYGG